jgi:pilus assembly protein CpaB
VNRIGPGFLLIVFFAILAGLAGVYIWRKNSQVAVVAKPAPPKPIVVVVASIDLPSGRVVHASDFASVSLSQKELNERAKDWPAMRMVDGRQILNRRIKNPVKQGQPFSPDTFYPEGIEPDLTEKLEPGMRAFSISFPAEGFPTKVTPGVMVDVLFRTKPEKNSDLPEISRTLVERVQILAIGNNATFGSIGLVTSKVDTNDRTITLAVTPQQALVLKTADGHGEFSIALRGSDDDVGARISLDLTLRDIFDLPEPEPEPTPFVAEVFRRGKRQTITFDPKGNFVSQNNLNNGGSKKRPLPPSSNAVKPDDDLPRNNNPSSDMDTDSTEPLDDNARPEQTNPKSKTAPKGIPRRSNALPSSKITMSEQSQ